jgi:ABC-type uncharacterized transport system substrate-binding protein
MNYKHILIGFQRNFISVKTSLSLFILIFLVIVCSAHAASKQDDIIIIVPHKKEPYLSIINSIQRDLRSQKNLNSMVFDLQFLRNNPQKYLNNKKLVISIGTKAIDFYLSSNFNSPFIISLTTKSALTAITSKTKKNLSTHRSFVGGISLDQPPRRYAKLAKLIKPKITSIGVALGPISRFKKESIDKKLKQIGAKVNIVNIAYKDNPVKKLRTLFQNNQLVVVFPDKAEFNRSLARWVISLSYKYQVPVISYSKKYADAGALISLYSTPTQIAKQTTEMAVSYLQHGLKPKLLLTPKYFDIRINQSVNQALEINLLGKTELLRRLNRVLP